MSTVKRQICLSDLNTDENRLTESLGHRSKARQRLLFYILVEAVISTCLFPWRRARHWIWEAVLDAGREFPVPMPTEQSRVKHGFICKEALAKLSAFLP